MLRNHIPLEDSILVSLAASDKTRGLLYDKLVKYKIENYFPARYKNQKDLARSYIAMENNYDRMDSLVYLSKKIITYKQQQGYVYFFKYRIQQANEWKIAMSGLQPLNEKEIASDPMISILTEIKIKKDAPLEGQLDIQLKRALFTFYKSGKNFYSGSNSNY